MHQPEYRINDLDFVPSESAIIVMNPDEEAFKHSFSKFEFITSMQVLKKAASKYSIPLIGIRREYRNSRTTEYIMRKQQQKMISLMSPSSFDEEYLRQFRILDLQSSYTVYSEDIFTSDEVARKLDAMNVKSILISGFYTESDVYVSAVEALIHDYFPFVVSDATSTISERVYFEALDLLAQHVEVIDSRDLIRVWGID
ncbi:isochorismatase family protein [Thermoplasma acidophilum]|nr:isochorismatase family protein [Thermoplasma acidophilum]